MEKSAQELAGVCMEEMIQNLRHNVAEEKKARREEKPEDYPMNGRCCP